MSTRILNGKPNTLSLYSRAVLASLIPKKSHTLPKTELVLPHLTIDREQLANYNRVCGFIQKDTLPATFPFVLAFPLHMELITGSDFPYPAMGLVHITNVISQYRPIRLTEKVTLKVKMLDEQPHDKGVLIPIETTVYVGDELVWDSVSTMLHRKKVSPSESSRMTKNQAVTEKNPIHNVLWKVPADTGRRYASVSGDRNPIHLADTTAKLFGFKHAIAHGMWTKARCLAQLNRELPERFSVQVDFKLPIFLPAQLAFISQYEDQEIGFSVVSQKSGKPHITGQITVL